MGAIGVILVATAAVSGVRLGRTGLLVLLAATLVSLATNLALLRDGGLSERNGYALQARTGLAMLDLAGDDAVPDYVPPVAIFSLGPHRYEAGRYLAAAERYGSVGLPLAEIEGAGLVVRELADRGLAGAKEIELTRGSGGAAAGACREYEGAEAAAGIELPRGGATLLAGGRGAPTVRVGRFAPPSVELGRLGPHGSATLRIAPDSYRRPWLISVAGARSVEVCALS
jgi:hypothetical protein